MFIYPHINTFPHYKDVYSFLWATDIDTGSSVEKL